MKKRKDGRYCYTTIVDNKKKFIYGYTQKELFQNIKIFYYNLEHPVHTFKEIAKEWESLHSEEVAYKTWSTYQGHLNTLITIWGEKDILKIDTPEITNILQQMAAENYSEKTVRTRFNVCNMVMQHAVKKGYLTNNPCELAKIPKGLKRNIRDLPEDSEIQKVMNSLSCHFGLFAYFLLFTGLRRGEALAVKWEDINFEKATININKAIYFESNRPKFKSTKTTSGIRIVPLLEPLKAALLTRKKDSGYLFGNEEPMTEQAFKRAWEHYKKDSGITITPHQLRHAFATILYEANVDPKSAQKIMGHSDYKTTIEIYTHISNRKEKIELEKLNIFIDKYCSKTG